MRTILAQPAAGAVADQLEVIADKLGRQSPAVGGMLIAAALAICDFAALRSLLGRDGPYSLPTLGSTTYGGDGG